MCWYRLAIELFDQPMMSIAARSGTPSSSSPHVCQTSGESVRLSQALAGAGVIALAGTR